jgi:hypothetical protein
MKTLTDYTGPFPVITLVGTDFLVNACTMQLIEAADPTNKIDYFDMIDLQDHLELVYDTSTKSSYQGRWDQYHEKDNTQLFWLRPFGAMDPAGMNELMDQVKPGWRRPIATTGRWSALQELIFMPMNSSIPSGKRTTPGTRSIFMRSCR